MKQEKVISKGIAWLGYPIQPVYPEEATRGKVGKVIDSVYVNETKKTTTVKFVDGSIQTVTCHAEDVFDPVVGVAIAVSSFVFGSKKNFHDVVARKIKKSGKSK